MPPEPGASGGIRAAKSDPVFPSSSTRVFALLGEPIAHSLSPAMHNAAFAAEGLDAVYVALRCAADDVGSLMRTLAGSGGGNVTVPWKAVAAAQIEAPSAAVARTGACNTFWREDGKLAGDNTDVVGFARALREFRGEPRGASVLLLGAGGAAAAALAALLDAGVGQIDVLSRTPARGVAMLHAVGRGDARARPVGSVTELRQRRFDLVVNATPLGLKEEDPLPLALDGAVAFDAAFDLVYSPAGTPWTRALDAAGIAAVDGKEMLLQQAAAAFERWWSRPAPLAAMRAALQATSR